MLQLSGGVLVQEKLGRRTDEQSAIEAFLKRFKGAVQFEILERRLHTLESTRDQ